MVYNTAIALLRNIIGSVCTSITVVLFTVHDILVLLCLSLFALAAAWTTGLAPAPYALEDAEVYFENFMQKYERNYSDEREKQARFQIFKESLDKINSLNEKSNHAVFGITQFSDMSHEEFATKINCFDFSGRASRPTEEDYDCKYLYDEDIKYNDAPESFDWRDQGVVAPVKNQDACGSCFAFSAIGNIESQYAIKHKNLVILSEQQIVDCDKKNKGCGGGFMDVAMRDLIEKGGCESEADYPYKGVVDSCVFDATKVKVKLDDCQSFNLTSQENLKQLLYHTGPIAIATQGYGLQYYKKGIISDELCNKGGISHGVLLVGYGSEDGIPFWSVKNSWHTTFGEEGYFRMHRGEDALSCKVMNELMASAVVA